MKLLTPERWPQVDQIMLETLFILSELECQDDTVPIVNRQTRASLESLTCVVMSTLYG